MSHRDSPERFDSGATFQGTSRFEVVRRIGSGGFGIVYEVLDRERDARVALKTIAKVDPSAVYRLKKEFRALTDVRHPNLVELYELFSEGRDWFFTMELIDGTDLLTYVTRRTKPTGRLELVPTSTLSDPQNGLERGKELGDRDVLQAANPVNFAQLATGELPASFDSSRLRALTGENARKPKQLADELLDLSPRITPGATKIHAVERTHSVEPAAQKVRLLDEGRLRATLRQLAEGLRVLHTMGKLHRDVKPSNVLVTLDGRVVLVDFGIAIERSDREGLRSDGNPFAGTPEYMAPEQAAGLTLGPGVDWYGVGVLLYEALTGVLPFSGLPLQILVEKTHRSAAAPSSVTSRLIPHDLEQLCVELLRINPAERPTGDEILRRLGPAPTIGRSRRSSDLATENPTNNQEGPTSSVRDIRPIVHRGSSPDPTLVGRACELHMLNAAYSETRAGQPVTVLVHGRSGFGKTALVRAFLDALTSEGTVVLAGRCYERESMPYKALDSVVDELSRLLLRLPAQDVLAIVPRDATSLCRVFPVLERVSAIAEAPRRLGPLGREVDAQVVRKRAFSALRELLARLCDRMSIVMFIDDLQWGDADSSALLGELLAPPDAPLLLLLLGYRSEDQASPILRALGGDSSDASSLGQLPNVRTIALAPLELVDSETLAVSLLTEPDQDVDPIVARRIAVESSGNPLFIRELCRFALEDEHALRGSGIRLEKLLQRRVRELPADARRLLSTAAIAGRPVKLAIASAAADLSAHARSLAVDLLRVAHLVRTTGTRGTDVIEPSHDRIREAVVALLTDQERRTCHETLAKVLRSTGEPDPETLYLHFSAAAEDGDRAGPNAEAAVQYAEQSARKAEQTLAFGRAAEFWRSALGRIARDDPRAHNMRVAWADALTHAGRGVEAADAYLSASEDAPKQEKLELQRRAAEQLIVSGHIDRGYAAIVDVVHQLGLKLPATPLRALIELVFLRVWLAIRGYRHTLHDPLLLPPRDLTRIDVAWSLATGLSIVDNVRAAHFQTRNLLACLQAGEPARLLRALVLEAIFIALAGPKKLAKAAGILEQARLLAVQCKSPDWESLVELALASTAYFTGRFRLALEHADRFVALYREGMTSSRWELRASQFFGLSSLLYAGELIALRSRLPALLREAAERGDLFLNTNVRVGETHVYWLFDDQPEAAAQLVDEAMSRWSQRTFQVQHWYAAQAHTQIALYTSAGQHAYEVIEAAWPSLQRSLLLRVHHTRVRAHWLKARAAIGYAAESADRRQSLLDVAAHHCKILRGEDAAWSTAIAALVSGAISHAQGEIDVAVESFREAVDGFDGEGMPLFAASARDRLGMLIGGEEGQTLRRVAQAWMRSQHIARPDRFFDMMAPMFPAEDT